MGFANGLPIGAQLVGPHFNINIIRNFWGHMDRSKTCVPFRKVRVRELDIFPGSVVGVVVTDPAGVPKELSVPC